jgi:hypothetical protein
MSEHRSEARSGANPDERLREEAFHMSEHRSEARRGANPDERMRAEEVK